MRTFGYIALYACVESKKGLLGMSWQEVTEAAGVGDMAVFGRLLKGGPASVEEVLLLCEWVGIPAEQLMEREISPEDARRMEVARAAVERRFARDDGLSAADAASLRVLLEEAGR